MSRERQGLEQVAGQERNEAELLNGPSSEGEERNRDVVHARRFEDADGLFVPGSEAINPRTSPVPRLAPPPASYASWPTARDAGGGGETCGRSLRGGLGRATCRWTSTAPTSSGQITGIVGRREGRGAGFEVPARGGGEGSGRVGAKQLVLSI
ncbi:hypothetical protein THAOC_29195 [Thalassiosira oceanica]|uniref:Uncharacterized protein n=1 Tax=Thalassiosira oceanica TaxID=159749 RepID=K0RRT2_THAOC|nr:hypothetical protein THAOC_29195 [Thalassiosira oceanica]|eukprot:EJK51616.1 hypothetical protein THAOC_29195 [Thalassiosira oceanica]